jgi:hypothetical protein
MASLNSYLAAYLVSSSFSIVVFVVSLWFISRLT